MVTAPDDTWGQMLQSIQKQISPQSYETWFVPTRQTGSSNGTITVEVPNKFFKDWLLEHYGEQITRASESLGTKKIGVEFAVGEAPLQEDTKEQEGDKKGRGFLARTFERFAGPQEFLFNERYSFENFVIGGCNRFAHAASLAVAENPAKAYNPLFIYGGVGFGKTHLMQAIGQHAAKNSPRLKVTYISSERFTNQLISAIQNRTTQKFREKYRHQDILLIDDIHFISGKESTQEEFFHTFNALYDAHKQIVVSSDKSPKEIPGLEKRLVSRFEWGLVTDIQLPDFETRIAILKKKLEKEVVAVPDDVLFFIADNVKTNIRELEGALIRVMAYSSLIGQKIDLGVAKEVLKEVEEERGVEINVELIQKVVADHFGISSNDMRIKKRTRKIAFPRQIAMYLSRELTKLSLVEIGGLFGGRDHTTVMHGCERVEEDIKNNPHIKEVVNSVVTKIKKRG
ncbi:MAG: chromosomal replication initiator protein DnaA [Candidatus Omnitrophica bacterium]|nr:chromosomal replication initiator protein DnaA [Candidatus Omnitrophota bacterium]